MQEILGEQITVGVIASWVIQKIKENSGIPAINESSDKLNIILGSIAAMASASMIHWKFDPDAGSLVITGLTTANAIHFIWEFLKQFIFQEAAYRSMWKKDKP